MEEEPLFFSRRVRLIRLGIGISKNIEMRAVTKRAVLRLAAAAKSIVFAHLGGGPGVVPDLDVSHHLQGPVRVYLNGRVAVQIAKVVATELIGERP